MSIRETWYRKVGRRYIAVREAEPHNYITMPDGYTLTYRKDGATRWEYAVKPDSAGFMAAAMAARVAMEAAIAAKATYQPSPIVQYTKKELGYIKRFKDEMGMRYPRCWTQATAFEIAQAGIDAVRGAA